MSRSRYVTPSRTAERIERVRKLILALQVSELSREEIGGLLSMGPSGVRKYMVDLAGILESSGEHGHLICRLTSDKAKVANYLASLDAQAPARPIRLAPEWSRPRSSLFWARRRPSDEPSTHPRTRLLRTPLLSSATCTGATTSAETLLSSGRP